MKALRIITTLALSMGLFSLAQAGHGGGGGGGGGGSRSGGGISSFRSSGGNSGSVIKTSNSGNLIKNISNGQQPLRLIQNGSGSSPFKSNGSKGKIKIHLGIGLGTSRCYYEPIVVCSGPDVLFAPEPLRAEQIASGGVIELPGNWGGEAGYACLMIGEEYAYFKVLAWTEKGVKLEVPRLEINAAVDAKLLMVRSDRYAYPEIPVSVLPPLTDSASAVAGGGKVDVKPVGSVATTNAVNNVAPNNVAPDNVAPNSVVANNLTSNVANTVTSNVANNVASADTAKTGQTTQATPATDAASAPADVDGEGTFEQVERAAAGDTTTAKAK